MEIGVKLLVSFNQPIKMQFTGIGVGELVNNCWNHNLWSRSEEFFWNAILIRTEDSSLFSAKTMTRSWCSINVDIVFAFVIKADNSAPSCCSLFKEIAIAQRLRRHDVFMAGNCQLFWDLHPACGDHSHSFATSHPHACRKKTKKHSDHPGNVCHPASKRFSRKF